MGDGLMALFGAPMAHEDHALRACYAALALRDGMRPYAEGVFAWHGLRFSALAGEILRDVPPDREPLPRFKFSM